MPKIAFAQTSISKNWGLSPRSFPSVSDVPPTLGHPHFCTQIAAPVSNACYVSSVNKRYKIKTALMERKRSLPNCFHLDRMLSPPRQQNRDPLPRHDWV